MSFLLSPTSAILAPAAIQDFTPTGAVLPVTYEVLAGGVGGTIDSSGEYTAPADVGADTIKATDAQGNEALATVVVTNLQLGPARAAIRPGRALAMGAMGGTGPYTYRLLSGTGVVDLNTGIYTAPNVETFAAIQARDSLGALSPVSRIMVGTPVKLLCDILEQELELASGRVWLWDQKINEPNDFGMFIVLTELNPKPFGSRNTTEESGNEFSEVQGANFCSTVQIDIKSRGPEARTRKEEIILALKSVYSQQQQARNGFYVSSLSSSFRNLSGLDGTAIPYRFSVDVRLTYSVTKTKAVDYYDLFQAPEVVTDP